MVPSQKIVVVSTLQGRAPEAAVAGRLKGIFEKADCGIKIFPSIAPLGGVSDLGAAAGEIRNAKQGCIDLFLNFMLVNSPRFSVTYGGTGGRAARAFAWAAVETAQANNFPILHNGHSGIVHQEPPGAAIAHANAAFASITVKLANSVCSVSDDFKPQYIAEILAGGIMGTFW